MSAAVLVIRLDDRVTPAARKAVRALGKLAWSLKSTHGPVAVVAGVGGRRHRRRRRALDRRAEAHARAAYLRGPYVCPECYAVGHEPHPSWCGEGERERMAEDPDARDDDYDYDDSHPWEAP